MSKFNKVLNQKAVALSYDETRQAAPIIVAAGSGYTASKIMEIASQNNIPIYEDNSLATMLSQLELGQEIPEELYKSIVDIYVYFLNYVPTVSTDGEVEDTKISENINPSDPLESRFSKENNPRISEGITSSASEQVDADNHLPFDVTINSDDDDYY